MPSSQAPFEYFACVLYPENEEHKKILDIICNERRLFKEYVYILHNRDEVEDDEKDTVTEKDENGELKLKKEHYHVLYKYYTKKSENGMLACFGGKLSKIIGIRDYLNYGCYLTHTNPNAILQGKTEYDYDELHGTAFFMKNLNKVQNANFVQFTEVMRGIQNTRTGTLLEYLNQVEKYDDDLKDFIFNIVHKETRTITQVVNDIKSIKAQNIKYKGV